MCFTRYVQLTAALIAVGLLAACGGSQTGSISEDFAGIGEAVAISPTAVKLTWSKNEKVTEYRVFEASRSEALQTTVFDSVTIESLTPDTDYTFKVLGVQGSSSTGTNRDLKIRTWKSFDGVAGLEAVSDTSMLAKWEYDKNPLGYLVFVGEGAMPTAASTNNWTTVTARTQQKSYLVQNMKPARTYYVVVQAEYRTGEFERVLKAVSKTSATTFKTPVTDLSRISIGSLPLLKVTPITDDKHVLSGFRSQAFWKGNPVSDPLTGAGTVVFSANAGLPIGKVDGLSVKVTYGSGTAAESLTIENLSTYIKGTPAHAEIPAVTGGLAQGASFFGKAIARGDFNCDGADDIAVGVPDISLAQLGNTAPRTGAVFIYYSKKNATGDLYTLRTSPTPSLNPAVPGTDPQVITFDDLSASAEFGAALAAGNMNKDRIGAYPCDDLAVGAPSSNSQGEAFVFFGSQQGLKSAAHRRDLPINTGTCDGKTEGASCAAVRIVVDQTLIPTALTGGLAYNPFPNGNQTFQGERFGFSLAFVGDFDANGYEDLAIGAPYAPLAGRIPGLSANGGNWASVGYVNVYYGSKFGMGTVPLSTSTLRYTTISPPVPQQNMNFGYSVAGGADVDGQFKIPDANGTLNGGADLVIGAPGFLYPDYVNTMPSGMSAGTTAVGGSSPFVVIPADGGWVGSGSLSATTNYYGFPQKTTRVGAAFLYFGYSRPTESSTPPKDNWLACGNRGFNASEHFSCFGAQTSYALLFPRDANSREFGSSVAILGDPSRYKPNMTSSELIETRSAVDPLVPYEYYSDPNQDGYAEVFVGAPGTTVGANANTGLIWQFFGNPNRYYEASDFLNVMGTGNPADDSFVNTPSCDVFSGAPKKANCRPVILRSNSLSAGARLAGAGNQMTGADVTGDGLKDLVVGAPGDATTGTTSGSVLVFPSMKATGITASYKKFYGAETTAGDRLGTAVAAGNFNGDYVTYQQDVNVAPAIRKLADVFGGSPFDGSGAPAVGSVLGFLSSGLPLPSIMSASSDGAGGGLVLRESLASFQQYGLGDSTIVGDVNGDGYDDAVSKISTNLPDGTVQSDAVIYYGSALGLITTQFCLANQSTVFLPGAGSASECYPKATPSVGITVGDAPLPQRLNRPPNLPVSWYGKAVRAGDVNGDGFADVVFASTTPMAPGNRGLLVVYFGARGGVLNVVDPSFVPSVGDPQIVTTRITFSVYSYGSSGTDLESYIQRDVIAANDFNGDGYADLIIGEPARASAPMNNVVGGNTMLRAEDGAGVASGGGWNCGNPNDSNCTSGAAVGWHGRVYIVYGSARGYQTPAVQGYTTTDFVNDTDLGMLNLLGTEATNATKPCTPVPGNAATCAMTYMDNPQFENIPYGYDRLRGRFGATVITMRADKDLYPDVLIGTPDFTDISCWNQVAANQAQRFGRIYILYGSQNGVVAGARDDYYDYKRSGNCPADAETDPGLGIKTDSKLRAIAPALVNALPAATGNATNRNSRYLGTIASSPGDLNGDSFDDLVIALPNEQLSAGAGAWTNPGTVFVFWGPLCPMDNHPIANDWFQSDGYAVGSGQNNLNQQTYMSGAEPIGTPSSLVFRGSFPQTGVTSTCVRSSTLGIKPMPLKFTVLGATSGEQWGWGLSSAFARKGDVNKDGYDDLLVGSYLADDPVRNVTGLGKGVVYFGHPGGVEVNDFPTLSLSLNAAGNYRPLYVNPRSAESGSAFFRGNITTGDVNGDATADYMITSRLANGTGANKGIWIGTFFMFY